MSQRYRIGEFCIVVRGVNHVRGEMKVREGSLGEEFESLIDG
jgi:hypothetical protein